MKKGKAYIIGAGPGDFGLLTLKAKACVEAADCIIYDRLIPKEILGLNPKAEMIYLGKGNQEGGSIQAEINQRLVQKCLEGKTVARVKGGDPFVFGRGGEEIFALKEEEIPFEVIPGISSSISVPAYAGIPVTHRGLSRSFHVFTGHTQKNGGWHNFEAISKLEGTLVFLMGVKNLPKIVGDLQQHGKDPKTPIAIIEKGATAEQRVTKGRLDNILELAKERGVTSPAITIIGKVVDLEENFHWFDPKEASKTRILVTRATKDAPAMLEDIHQKGGIGKSLPFLEIEYLDFDLDEVEKASCLLLNSPNAVHALLRQIKDLRCLAGKQIGVVGSKTKEALEGYHLTADFMPEEYLGSLLAEEAAKRTKEGEQILILSSDIAPWSAEDYSQKHKRKFVKQIAYKTKKIKQEKAQVLQELKDVDVITFLSSSTAESFFAALEGDLTALSEKKIASIGPMTSKTLKELGFAVDYEAAIYTAPGLIDCILEKK